MNKLSNKDMRYVTSVLHIAKMNRETYVGIIPDHKDTLENILNELGPYCDKLPQIIEMLKTNAEITDWSESDAQEEFLRIYNLLKLQDE